MKFANCVLIGIVILLIGNVCIANEVNGIISKSWCWTKPVYDKGSINNINYNNGGINWGFCKKMTSYKDDINIREYTLYIRTSSLPQSEAYGVITISLIGTEATSKEIEITSTGFKSGAFDTIRIYAEDVGNLYAIKLIAKNRLQWRCSTIRIESHMHFWNFECDKTLSWPSAMIELNACSLIEYSVVIKVNSSEENGTSLPVYISIYGSTGKTPFKLLSNTGFMRGAIITKTIKSIDVGIIDKISLILNGSDDLLIDEIIIIKKTESEHSNIIHDSNKETIFQNINNSPINGLTPLILLSNTHNISTQSNPFSSSESLSILSTEDTNSIIKLSCTDILKDNDNFGPSYIHNTNYHNYLIECPHNCLPHPSYLPVYGIGIHPEESAICPSAIIDNASSLYGGIISLSIENGLPSYTGSTSIHSIRISSYAASRRSFTLSKVDNIDMIESDVRVLNNEGTLSSEGRLEVRVNGKWSTVCGVAALHGNEIAGIACRQLGYEGGRILNEVNGEVYSEGYCGNYNGVNYCGVDESYVIMADVLCKGSEVSVLECEYQSARSVPQCVNNKHNYDMMIKCEMHMRDVYGNDALKYKENTLRLIGFDGKIAVNGIGRVEIMRTSWGSICNASSYKRTNTKIAKVICKQMGYIDGRLYDKCNNVQGYNLCGDDMLPIKVSNLKCKGNEANILQCKHSDITIECSHANDITVKCIGYGDASGKTQNISSNNINNIRIPLLMKLPLPPIFPATCETTLKHIYFRGDPGSIFLINCPPNCHKSPSSLYGTGIYSMHSSLCKSGIHSGVISHNGGDVIISKTYGQNIYYNSTIRSIESSAYGASLISFTVTQVNSGYYYLGELYMRSSFIEMYNMNAHKEMKAVFEWVQSAGRSFEKKGYVDLTIVDNYRKVFEMKVFTIYMKVKMVYEEMKEYGKQTLYSIGGCEGFSICVGYNSEIIIDVKCGEKVYESGVYMPVNAFIILGIAYDGMKMYFYLNDKQLYEMNIELHMHYSSLSKLTLGKSSEYDIDFFNGDIKYIALFNEALSLTHIQHIFTHGYAHPDKVKDIKEHTVDDRECISICYNLPIPGYPGSPNPPSEAVHIKVDKNETNAQVIEPFIEVKCTTSLRDLGLYMGDSMRIKCPMNCTWDMLVDMQREYNKKMVIGSLVYKGESLLCYSAMHSGYIQMGYNDTNMRNNSFVNVNVLPLLQYYQGSFQYNIQSYSENITDASLVNDYSFSFEYASSVPIISCKMTIPSNISVLIYNLTNIKYQVICPPKCSKYQHNVYGDIVYSGDSSICQSAIHSGAITDKGGEVTFEIIHGLNYYPSKKSFNIISKEHNSYTNSIKFHNTNYKLTSPYIETCTSSSLILHWDYISTHNIPVNWQCHSNPTIHSNIKNPLTSYIIKQFPLISSSLPSQPASFLLLKDTDIINSLFQISFYFNTINPISIVFRYKDKNNMFHLCLCDNNNNKLTLYKTYEGNQKVMGEYEISFIPKMWYTFQIKVYYGEVEVLMLIGNVLSYDVVIYAKGEWEELQRGRIGIGVNGSGDVYVNNIYISDYNGKEYERNMHYSKGYEFDSIVKYNTLKMKDKYCKMLYERQGVDMNECKETHKYCMLRCNELVHRRENILHYTCYKRCLVNTIKSN